MSSEEVLLANAENVEEDVQAYQEVNVDSSQILGVLTDIYNDVHIIMVFTIITFATACFRGWRKNVIKGVR